MNELTSPEGKVRLFVEAALETGVRVPFSFTAVTGSKARVYFTAGTSTPIIYEFEVYNAA